MAIITSSNNHVNQRICDSEHVFQTIHKFAGCFFRVWVVGGATFTSLLPLRVVEEAKQVILGAFVTLLRFLSVSYTHLGTWL